MAAVIVDDKEQSRYEVQLDGETIAVADYVKQSGLASYIGDHGEFLALVPAERRAEFGLPGE